MKLCMDARVAHRYVGQKWGDSALLGPELVQETTKNVQLIKWRLETARNRSKSYTNVRRRPLAFKVGDLVFLKVSPKYGVTRFGMKGKISPRFIGPFPVVETVGEVAYRLDLQPQLSSVHPVLRHYAREVPIPF